MGLRLRFTSDSVSYAFLFNVLSLLSSYSFLPLFVCFCLFSATAIAVAIFKILALTKHKRGSRGVAHVALSRRYRE